MLIDPSVKDVIDAKYYIINLLYPFQMDRKPQHFEHVILEDCWVSDLTGGVSLGERSEK